jgi:hypothetical protein
MNTLTTARKKLAAWAYRCAIGLTVLIGNAVLLAAAYLIGGGQALGLMWIVVTVPTGFAWVLYACLTEE